MKRVLITLAVISIVAGCVLIKAGEGATDWIGVALVGVPALIVEFWPR